METTREAARTAEAGRTTDREPTLRERIEGRILTDPEDGVYVARYTTEAAQLDVGEVRELAPGEGGGWVWGCSLDDCDSEGLAGTAYPDGTRVPATGRYATDGEALAGLVAHVAWVAATCGQCGVPVDDEAQALAYLADTRNEPLCPACAGGPVGPGYVTRGGYGYDEGSA